MKKISPNIIAGTFFGALTVFLGVSLFVWTIPPYHQMRVFFKHFLEWRAGDETALLNAPKAFEPFTYVQPELRFQYMDFFFKDFSENPTSHQPANLRQAVAYMEDSVAHEPNYAPQILALGKSYDLLANLNPDQGDELRTKAEKQYIQALKIFPGNQRILYAYAINLASQGRMSEGLALLEKVKAGDSRIAETDYYLGALLYMEANEKNADKALPLFERALTARLNPLPILTETIYKRMLTYYYGRSDLDRFKTVASRLEIFASDEESETYRAIIDYIDKNNSIPSINFNVGK